MPIYTFKNLETGQMEEHFRTINRRDCVPPHLQRVFTPPRHGGFIVGANSDDSPEAKVPKALRQLEEGGMNWRDIEHKTGFKRETLRDTWAM